MYTLKNNLFPLYIIIIYLIINTYCIEEIINTKDLNEITQCFYQEKSTYAEKEEIVYEIINNNYNKTLFIQFRAIELLSIYQLNQDSSSIIYTKTKEENDFGNYYFTFKNNIEKYYIKVELSQSDLVKFKICFNLFDGKGNTFKENSNKNKNTKISSYNNIINSGKYPFYIKDDINSFNSFRYHQKYEQFFEFSSFRIKAYIDNTEEVISLHENELFNKGEYNYLLFNLGVENNKKIKDIIIEVNLNIKEDDEENNEFEIELVNNKEINYEYKLNVKKNEYNIIPIEVYYINLKKYIFQQDLDVLYLTNNKNNDIFLSYSDNINDDNIIYLNKRFMVINRDLLENQKYKKINPELLIIIIDESFKLDDNEEIFYSFMVDGSSHDKYIYKEDITKNELFNNNKKIIIMSDNCHTSFYINYFTDINEKKILEYESVIGNTNLYYTNLNDISNDLTDYLNKIDLYPIDIINNSILKDDYGIIKMNCLKDTKKVLSYLYIHDINSLNEVIFFKKQKILLNIEKDKNYSFEFDEKIKEEQFNFRTRILKKEKGDCNVEINYNNIYNILDENNFLELKHDKGTNAILNIFLKDYSDIPNQQCNSIILEIIKEIDIDENLIKIQKSPVEDSTLLPEQFLFFEYENRRSPQSKIILKNEENKNATICIHKGYGIYPYLIKPICENNEYINLKQNEELILTYDNPYISPVTQNINCIDNPLYIGIYTDNKIKYNYLYEKYSIYNTNNGYKDINFNGKEIIELEQNKNFPMMYYQIVLCLDFDNNIEKYSYNDSLFNYYFDKKDNIEITDVKKYILKEYELHTDNPVIVFNTNGELLGKFKYKYGDKNKLNYYNDNYSNKINLSQENNILKISVESPFRGDITLSILLINSNFNFNIYKGYCEVIDLYEDFKKDMDIMYDDWRIIQKNIYVGEGDNIVNIEIDSENILEFNKKKLKIFAIITLNEIDLDVFYDPVVTYISLRDHLSIMEGRIIIAIIIFIALVFIIFLIYRYFKKKRRQNINYDLKDMKEMKLDDGNISDSNHLF